MLTITIPASEAWDAQSNKFVYIKEQTLCLEHSLVSVSKWEAKWHRPFLDRRHEKTEEEAIDYIRCMTITQNVDQNIYYFLTDDNLKAIQKYIDDPMTATTFVKEEGKGGSTKITTSEIIYYWMIAQNIPMECQKWHLNRLLTLIRVCNEENKPKKKQKKGDQIRNYAALNAQRRAASGSRG